MCTLVASKNGNTLTLKELESGYESNRTSWGWASATEYHRQMQAPTEEDYNTYVEKCKGVPHVVHFRLASHGSRDIANCHPFRLENGGYLAHNGIFSGLHHATMSDTAMTIPFANYLLTQTAEVREVFMYYGLSADDYKNQKFADALERLAQEPKAVQQSFAGGLCAGWNKVAIISEEHGLEIFNESATGTIMDAETGIWYSNSGCKRYVDTNPWNDPNRRSSFRESGSSQLPRTYNSAKLQGRNGSRYVVWNGSAYIDDDTIG